MKGGRGCANKIYTHADKNEVKLLKNMGGRTNE